LKISDNFPERGDSMSDESISFGLKLELVPLKTIYRAGELPAFNATFTNISFDSITLCTYLIKHRLLSGLYAGDYRVYPFGTTFSPPLTDSDFKIMAPNDHITVLLDMAEEKDYHFLLAAKLPRVVPEDMAVTVFPAASYSFCIHLGPYVAYYIADDGTHAHQRVTQRVLSEVERSPELTFETAKAWDGSLIAYATVTFVEA